jgi:hypothetical protein
MKACPLLGALTLLLIGTTPNLSAQHTCPAGGANHPALDRWCRTARPANPASPPATPNGSRPASGQRPVYYGPSGAPVHETPAVGVGQAPPHIRHMSPRCSALHDALRTAPARGLRHDTIATMRRDYQAECGENEREAMSVLSLERGEQAQQRQAERRAGQIAREQASLRAEQCEESKRILWRKRARTDLSEGERAELARFEQSWRERCGG